MIFDAASYDDHEQVAFCRDKASGLKAIIAIHRPGPKGRSLGGCRMVDYASEEAAVEEAVGPEREARASGADRSCTLECAFDLGVVDNLKRIIGVTSLAELRLIAFAFMSAVGGVAIAGTLQRVGSDFFFIFNGDVDGWLVHDFGS